MANKQLKAKLIFCSVPTKNSPAARQFYDALFGGEDFARSLNEQVESYYRPISQDGLTLTISARQNERESITCFFAVDDLSATVSQLEALGGQVVVKPTPVAISGPPDAKKAFGQVLESENVKPPNDAGTFAGMLDPDGNYLALMQLDSSTQRIFHAQPKERTLSESQVAALENWKEHGDPAMR